MNAGRIARAALLALALGACSGPVPLPAPETGSVAVASQTALGLQRRAQGFYLRLQNRRFNSLETYHDYIMRGHFQQPELFLDYYADLAEGLVGAHFERGRPIEVEIEQYLFEDGESARVQVRFVGGDNRPLRPGRVSLIRVDHWRFVDGNWWIQPEKA
jgi:hypothetical protein